MILSLQATPEEVMRAVDALREFATARGLSERAVFGLSLALEECGSNIVNYALSRDPLRTFSVSLEHTGNTFAIELRDAGPEFDPTRVPADPAQGEGEDRSPGGWGIQLVRRYVDEMSYARIANQNVLRLIKRIEPERQNDLPIQQ